MSPNPLLQFPPPDISPWYVGQLAPAWKVTFVANQLPISLTGGTTVSVLFALAGAAAVAGTGAGAIADAPNGVVTYQPSAGDVAAPGPGTQWIYRVYFQVLMPNGLIISDPMEWVLTALT